MYTKFPLNPYYKKIVIDLEEDCNSGIDETSETLSDSESTIDPAWGAEGRRRFLITQTMQEVASGVFLGPSLMTRNRKLNTLKDHGITHIVCVHEDPFYLNPKYPDLFQYLPLDIFDHSRENIKQHFENVSTFITKCLAQGGKVLIHGYRGISRSATLAVAYLMRTNGMSVADALSEVKSKRFCICPNRGFLRQLVEYEAQLSGLREEHHDTGEDCNSGIDKTSETLSDSEARICDPVRYAEGRRLFIITQSMQEVTPGVFLGPFLMTRKRKLNTLMDHGITHIVCVHDKDIRFDSIPKYPELFQYFPLNIENHSRENIKQHFENVSTFITKGLSQGGKVLIHGYRGRSRSATLAVAYLLRTNGMSVADALSEVKSKRFCICPNRGFLRQLVEYEAQLREEHRDRSRRKRLLLTL